MTTEQRDMYGIDATEWLRRWDEEGHVWSIEMGGLGPGYEQAIQVLAVEMVRWMVNVDKPNPADWSGENAEENYEAFRKRRDAAMFAIPAVNDLGLSGAQAGAAGNLAANIYQRGPAACFRDEQVKDRLIQVRSKFPTLTD